MNTVLRKHFAVAIVLFFYLHPLSAQNKKLFNGKRHRIGCIAGAGGQDLSQLTRLTYSGEVGLDVTYNYRVIFFQAQYYYALLRGKTWGIDVLHSLSIIRQDLGLWTIVERK